MITYVYKCNNCEDVIEVKQRMSDDKLTKCEKCGEDSLERQIQGGTFLLKGSGWCGRSHVNGKTKRFNAHDSES